MWLSCWASQPGIALVFLVMMEAELSAILQMRKWTGEGSQYQSLKWNRRRDCYLFFFDGTWQRRGCVALLLCTGGQTPSMLVMNLEVDSSLLQGLASGFRLLGVLGVSLTA